VDAGDGVKVDGGVAVELLAERELGVESLQSLVLVTHLIIELNSLEFLLQLFRFLTHGYLSKHNGEKIDNQRPL